MATLSATATHARSELVERAARTDNAEQLFRLTSERLRRLVPFDAAVWLASDPGTGLPTEAARTEEVGAFGADGCRRYWELEFMVDDVNAFSALARAREPAGGLRLATDDRPARSARYRTLLRPSGFGDELRGVLRSAGSPWGLLALFRAHGEPPFDEHDSALVSGLSAPLAVVLRDHARPAPQSRSASGQLGPGLMLFAPTGELVSMNDDALAWLDELAGDVAAPHAFTLPLPTIVVGTLMRARAIAEERERGSARARIKSRATGRWLVCHASCLRDADGDIGNTALVIEPAPAAEIAPLITQAYELTEREQQITQLIARGCGTATIANELFLSPHTVRDYIKAVFAKVGVSSRGELVAMLFAAQDPATHPGPDAPDDPGT